MIPTVLKSLFVPGSVPFFVIAVVIGTLLLYRKNDRGRAGKILLTVVAVFYWLASTPLTAVFFINLLTRPCPGIRNPSEAKGATAVVALGAGMQVFRSRGDVYEISPREDALRMLETARVYKVLGSPWVIVTGGYTAIHSEAQHMDAELRAFGIPPDRIIEEAQATNTRDHGIYVPVLLRQHNVKNFVLVTSRQHMTRALAVFRKAGWNPVPSCPEPFAEDDGIKYVLPSRNALEASYDLVYDLGGWAYYKVRGWI